MQNETFEGFRLSPQQKHLWLLQQDNNIYFSQVAILLEGIIDIEVLQAAIQKVINRHEILRTNFHRRLGIKFSIQVIVETSTPSWCSLNLRNLNQQEQALKIEELLQQERSVNLNLEKESIVRLSLLTLADNQHILIISLPSLCADSWTLKNLVKEISQNYTLCLQGKELLDEPVQYIQFSEWQNELLAESDTKATRDYWQEKEFKNIEILKLPFELNNKKSLKFKPDVCYSIFPNSLSVAITNFVTKNNTNYEKFLLTCWYILIYRLTKKPEIVINNLFHSRKYKELYDILGLLAKFLPISCPITQEFKFLEILTYISEHYRQAEKYQEYFFKTNVINSNKDLLSLLICFEFEDLTEKYNAGNLSFSIYQQFVCFEKFKIKLTCLQKQEFLITEFYYDPNLFSTTNIQGLARQFKTLVKSIVANLEVPVGQLEIIDSEERHQLLVEFNKTQINYPQNKCFHQLFEEQVNKTPNNIAVVFEEQQLTYAELNLRADRLSYYLRQLEVKPEVLVGLYTERSLDTIVGILGILKAGGAYLPLDPTLPEEALAYRLQDASISVILTQRSLVAKIPVNTTQIICLDTDWELIDQENQEDFQTAVQPENLVYAIYTSGSTGKPKAVAIEHCQLVNYIYAIIDRLNLPKGASFATVSTFAADLGNTVIFSALCTGGCLHIISQEKASDPQALADYFQHHPVDCLKIVPSHLTALLASSLASSILPRLSLILGGEASSWELIEQLQQVASDCEIFNHYGPTETTIGVLTYPITQTKQLSSTVPLGRPLANTQVYILDEQLQLVPIGVPGELYIGGAGLARGYLNQPELTAARFIKNPFVSDSQERLYKTGDQVRYLSDGNLEFLGRVDRQIKIRGFRLELEEIETILKQYLGIQEVVVTAREETLSNKRLVAYIVTNPQFRLLNHNHHSAIASELRSFCLNKLPEYAIPSAFVLMKALPLTPNGKIDYQALPTPEQTRPELEQLYIAPRTLLEKQLAEIWSEILGLEQVGIYDNFFELGGHSLLITQLLAKIRKAFSVELPLKDLFNAPTIADLAAQIDQQQISDTSSINFHSEAVLDPTIVLPTKSLEQQTKPAYILLTGATGFLGAFLLYELLQKTTAEIYCLIRAKTTIIATERLQNHLKSYLLWDESFNKRIVPLIGDLSQPLLGLSVEKFDAIAAQIDIIYHNGALVNFTYPYSQLKPANVLGTQEILRLAAQVKIKPVHFISTIGVVGAADSRLEIIREDTPIKHSENIGSGYTQSKWVAEKLVTTAGERGIPISIYRPGRISGHSKTGVCNTDDHTFRMIRGCIQLGSVPNHDTMVNLTPVDYASQAIIYLSQQKASLGKIFHLINPQPLPWREVANSIISFGYPLKQIDYTQWRSQLLQAVERSPENALYPLIATFADKESQNTSIEDSTTQQLDLQNTLTGLTGTAIICPPLDRQLLNTYLSYLIHNGFLV